MTRTVDPRTGATWRTADPSATETARVARCGSAEPHGAHTVTASAGYRGARWCAGNVSVVSADTVDPGTVDGSADPLELAAGMYPTEPLTFETLTERLEEIGGYGIRLHMVGLTGGCSVSRGINGRAMPRVDSVEWRQNGALDVPRRDPNGWRLPVKYGLRAYGYVNAGNVSEFHAADDCAADAAVARYWQARHAAEAAAVADLETARLEESTADRSAEMGGSN